VVKQAWGTKRTCPKCDTRFYDLGKDNPCVCIECATEWVPEPILKAKQSIIAPPPAAKKKEEEKTEAEEVDEGAKDEDDELKGLDVGDDVEVEDNADDDSALDNVSIEEDETDVSDVIDTAAAAKENQ
jgi:uncharacterized protein (TIGR02300 family)